MYNFVYYFIYNQQLQKGKSEWYARGLGGMVAALPICLHGLLILIIFKKILLVYFNIQLKVNYSIAKQVTVLIFFLLSFWFKSKKTTERIMAKLTTDKDPTRTANAIKVVIIIFLPIILALILSQRPK
jgi:hypothetical protein